MFYYASKILWFVATPSNALVALGLVGALIRSVRRPALRRLGSVLAGSALLGLALAGLSPLANWVILPLEERFPPYVDDGRPVSGIVVLGGSVLAQESVARGELILNDAGERVLTLGELARRFPDAKLVFSGGSGALIDDEPPEADVVARFARAALDIRPERLVVESRSRTTHENALFSRRLVEPRGGERWLLVTSAWHMPRAMGCFRHAGFPVVPYPVDYRTRGPQDRWRLFASVSDGLRRLDLATKEWIGLLGYRVAGYTDALFPGSSEPGAGSGKRMR